MSEVHNRAAQAAGAVWLLVILPLAVLLLSVGISPESNWTVRAALAAFCMLAVIRPADAVLATIALPGFGIILAHLAGIPYLRVAEVMAVASVAGYCVRAAASGGVFRRALRESISLPVVLFAMAAVASTVVWLRVYQVQSESASWTYVQALLQYLSHGYFIQPDRRFLVVVSTAAVIESLALYVVVAALCRVEPAFFDRALRMLAVGGAGLGVLSVIRLAEIVLRNPRIVEILRSTYAGLRISPQIPDYIAAGSYFGLCWVVALGIAIGSRRHRLAWVLAGIPLLAGLYLTGSRSPIAAAIAGIAVLTFAVVRRGTIPVRGVVVFAVVAVIAMVITFRIAIGHDVAGDTARASLIVRRELVRTGLRVMATRPLFGVGIDRFYLAAEDLATPRLNAMWQGRKNPHNDFLRVGAELGLVGLALFLWILVSAGRRIRPALRHTGDPRLAGLVGGLVVFIITSFTSNPLMLREVSYVFWIALGLAVARSEEICEVPAAEKPLSQSLRASRLRWQVALVLGVPLLISVPFRARQELASAASARVSSGLFDWDTDQDGTPFRLSGPEATVYVDVPPDALLLEIPFRGTLPSGALQQVEIRVDGRVANRVAVGAQWQRVRILLRPDPFARSRRLDLVVSPAWVPADVLKGNQDRRVLGAKLGQIRTLTSSNQVR